MKMYDAESFFYDDSFEDYPIITHSLIELMNEYINKNIITWNHENTIYYHTFNGLELQNLAKTLLRSYAFSNLTLDKFLPLNTPIHNSKLRVLNISSSRESGLKMHSALEILSINIRAIKINNLYFTAEIYITAHFETNEEMPL